MSRHGQRAQDAPAWRARLRRNRTTAALYRVLVGVVGGAVTVLGLIAVPAPGPGWLIVFLGLTILASEFELAQRVLHFARAQVGRWNAWVLAQPVWRRLALGAATLLVVWGACWAYLAWHGVPAFAPQWAEDALLRLPGVS
ncbi:MAG TPA: TIGR02611 family protein [Intrasporangium sp.]|uniref:TIGR02611 family protein n=1 Tax=Intrasporangium sp. TaxID=1925024 RepID=UPI002D77FF05|nr:TIGR02611 family protein [Intrasporangium sp.]HET7399070.1 TIGR02611 family protein [Intrasporangium sp.]